MGPSPTLSSWTDHYDPKPGSESLWGGEKRRVLYGGCLDVKPLFTKVFFHLFSCSRLFNDVLMTYLCPPFLPWKDQALSLWKGLLMWDRKTITGAGSLADGRRGTVGYSVPPLTKIESVLNPSDPGLRVRSKQIEKIRPCSHSTHTE